MPKDIEEGKADEGDGVFVGLCPNCELIHMAFERAHLHVEARLSTEEAIGIRDALDEIIKRLADRQREGSAVN